MKWAHSDQMKADCYYGRLLLPHTVHIKDQPGYGFMFSGKLLIEITHLSKQLNELRKVSC